MDLMEIEITMSSVGELTNRVIAMTDNINGLLGDKNLKNKL